MLCLRKKFKNEFNIGCAVYQTSRGSIDEAAYFYIVTMLPYGGLQVTWRRRGLCADHKTLVIVLMVSMTLVRFSMPHVVGLADIGRP